MIETDEVLVARSQKQDRAAFEELVRRTARLLFARLYLDTGRSDQAEDLAQETLLVAWRSIGQLTDPTGFRPWLLSIARTVRLDAVRHRSRRKRWGIRVSDSALGQRADPAPQPPEAAQRLESRRRVLAMLRALPEEYRLPLTLRYIGGADYETISGQLGLTNGSLRGLLNRGMALLRQQMSDDLMP